VAELVYMYFGRSVIMHHVNMWSFSFLCYIRIMGGNNYPLFVYFHQRMIDAMCNTLSDFRMTTS